MKKLDLSKLKNLKLKKIKFSKLKINNLNIKIIRSIILIFIILVFAISTYFLKRYQNSNNYIKNKYISEIKDVLNIGSDNKVINIIKEDLNNDNITEYICMYGKPIYSSDSYINKKIVMYQNVSILIVDDKTKEITKYETTKTFNNDVELSIKQIEDRKYIFASSKETDNVIFIRKQDNNIIDVIKDSFGDNLTAYIISYLNEDIENKKITLKLDNNATSYLPVRTEEYTLDFTNTNIDLTKYRHSYLKNRFSNYIIEKNNEDNLFDFVCIENVLCLNNNEKDKNLQKYIGKVKVIFSLQDDKLIIKDVKVEI